jgi:hypothetical protein
MTLGEASNLLGIPTNTLRSRFKAGKIRGERDNSGRLWVWIDTSKKGSENPISKNAKPVRNAGEIEALKGQVSILQDQLGGANAELAILRPRASETDRLKAERTALEAQVSLLVRTGTIGATWRKTSRKHIPSHLPQPGFWSRLFGRQGNSPSGE